MQPIPIRSSRKAERLLPEGSGDGLWVQTARRLNGLSLAPGSNRIQAGAPGLLLGSAPLMHRS